MIENFVANIIKDIFDLEIYNDFIKKNNQIVINFSNGTKAKIEIKKVA